MNQYLNIRRYVRRCVLKIFLSFRLVFRGILIIERKYDRHYSGEKKSWGFKISYLLKRKKEDQLGHLFGVLLRLKIGRGFLFLMSCYFSVRQLAFTPAGYICQGWSIMADIGLVGRQGIVDRLATSADSWRIGAVILLRWLLENTDRKYYDASWEWV